MLLTARFVRRLALTLVALYAFGLGTVALAACGMDRAEMAQARAMASGPEHDCHEAGDGSAPLDPVCAAHCTADVQFTGIQPVAVHGFPDIAVLVVEAVGVHAALPASELPPPGPPRRILLHSFLI